MRVLLNLRDLLAVGVSGATTLICVSQGMATPIPVESHEGSFPNNLVNRTRLQYKTFQVKTFEQADGAVKFQEQVLGERFTPVEEESEVSLFKPFKQTADDEFSQTLMPDMGFDLAQVQLNPTFTLTAEDQPFTPGISTEMAVGDSSTSVQLFKPVDKLSPQSSQSSQMFDQAFTQMWRSRIATKPHPFPKDWEATVIPQSPIPVEWALKPEKTTAAWQFNPEDITSVELNLDGSETANPLLDPVAVDSSLESEPLEMSLFPPAFFDLDHTPVLTNATALQRSPLAVGWESTGVLPPVSTLPPSSVETQILVSSPPVEMAQVDVDRPTVDIPDLTPPAEPYPQPAPNGTLQTNPPPITQPSPNPLYRPNSPEQVEIQETVPITLEQAVDLARRNNSQIKQFALQVEQQLAAVREAQAALYPTLSFTSSLARTESAQTTLSSRATNRSIRNARRQGNPAGNRPFAVPFGTTSFNNTLQLVYDFGIDGSRHATIRANEEQLRNTELDLERVIEDLRSNVTESYYDLQQADANVEIQRSAVRNAQKSLEDAEALERAGVGTRFEVLQARVTLSRNQQNLTNAISDQRASRRALATILNVSQNANLVTADPIELAGAWDYTLDETIILAYQNRSELEEELTNRDIAEQQRQAALAATRPRLTASANYNVLGLVTDDPDRFASRGWADGYSVQVQLQWNFFDGGVAKSRARQREIDIALAEERFSQLRNQIRLESERAFYDLQANFENIGVANLGVEEATEALRLARLRFQAGVGTQTDVINQETALTQARNQLLQAIIGYNRSLSQLWRAVSNLPGGNLQDKP